MSDNSNAKVLNYVHQAVIMNETIKKESRHRKIFTEYGINPFKKKHFAEVIRRGALEPSKRYIEPQTENQEYGWISQPLMVTDRFDSRFNHPKVACEITKFMDTFWKLNEQRKLNS
ncbi:hypothetical protein EWB00_009624 [Schistosoma japonicum]|uniref:Protein FAM183A n=1 Tax=Schistosoma japonicum TaxID=6182 RepID=A0A4Z2CLN8_SCHJA|nr:family with sequence similarity 183 member A [Schistosoma japonicum]TNN05148.1 hypothetical protein EWB00_009624 [Schistosoma japonicum]